MSARHLFVDETKHRDYLLVASAHIATEVAPLRAALRELLLPNQRCLHMKDERESRKRQIAGAIVSAGVQAVVYRAGADYRTEKQRREACLRQLVSDNAREGETVAVFDQDDSLLRWDNQRLIEFTRAENCRDTFRYEHRNAPMELMLAVPDAIAWCWAKGGVWKARIQPVVIGERDV